MTTGIAAGIRTAKTPSNPYGWKNVELSAIDFSKPTVFCISGDATFKEKDANAMAKYANKLLGRIGVEGASDLQIVSVFFTNANPKELYNSRTCLREKDKSRFSAEEQNPQYIKTLYQECFRKLISDKRRQKIDVKQAQKNLRNITFLNFCHGDFVTCKLNEYMNTDMKENLGYTNQEISAITKQACCISIVPQDTPKKYSFSKIGFASLDDYHYNSEDAEKLTDYYELDYNETSIMGIAERQRECNKGRSRLICIDNLLDYNSVEDKLDVWLGKTEKLHQLDVYTEMNYQNEFGIKSKTAENFSLMISRALQNAVSSSCKNASSSELVEIDIDNIFKTQKAEFKQGPQELNGPYLNPDVEEVAKEAQTRGNKIDAELYPSTSINQFIKSNSQNSL